MLGFLRQNRRRELNGGRNKCGVDKPVEGGRGGGRGGGRRCAHL